MDYSELLIRIETIGLLDNASVPRILYRVVKVKVTGTQHGSLLRQSALSHLLLIS